MPIEIGIWRINDNLEKIHYTAIDNEKKLETALCEDISILDKDLLLLGNQVLTSYGKAIDMLAIDPNGDLVVIELKRNRTPREVTAQVLDYASWVEGLTPDQIISIFAEKNQGKEFEQVFSEKFDTDLPERINEKHRLLVVASELDNSTERIINYLSNNGIPINAVFFRYFKDGDNEYLTRSWLIDPTQAEIQAGQGNSNKRRKEIWNGRDWYFSLGVDQNRNWDDCQKYGFVSAGGGKWYSNTLKLLPVGARIFVCVPKKGYVGVGIVKESVLPVSMFTVVVDGIEKPILDVELKSKKMGEHADDLEKCEYLVRIEWLKKRPLEKPFWEKGMFANQNSACKLRNNFTIERLTEVFNLREEE